MKHQTDRYSLDCFNRKAAKFGMWLVSLTIINNLAEPAYLMMSSKQHKSF